MKSHSDKHGKDDDFWAIQSGITLQLLYRLALFFIGRWGMNFWILLGCFTKTQQWHLYNIAQKNEESPRFWITWVCDPSWNSQKAGHHNKNHSLLMNHYFIYESCTKISDLVPLHSHFKYVSRPWNLKVTLTSQYFPGTSFLW